MTERACPANDDKPCRWWQCVENSICIGAQAMTVRKRRSFHIDVPPVTDDDLIEGQKVAEALAENFPNEMNSHKGRLFLQCKLMVAALVRDIRLNGEEQSR